jgi:RNA polymerase sigma factor (TIGR02999 family)
MDSGAEVNRLLGELNRGNRAAMDQLMPLVYHELHAIATRYFGRERRDHTLQATALVHEAYIRLVDQNLIDWQNRLHFLGIAAVMMRRILVDHARARSAVRRGEGLNRVPFEDAMATCEQRAVEIVALDEALSRLAKMDAVQAKVVELRFFGGMSVEETAQALKISTPTVKRYWQSARAWLRAEISKGGPNGRGAVGAS